VGPVRQKTGRNCISLHRPLRIDLEAAGVPYVVPGDDGTQHADFHSLRHSFITVLDRAGAMPAEAQKLARHSDVRLTLQRYTHHGLAGLGGTVERIALPMPGPTRTRWRPSAARTWNRLS
jgi:integrase